MSSLRHFLKRFLFTLKAYKLSSLQNRFYIIPYHMIVDEPNGFYPQTATSAFERQIKHLVENYQVVPLDEIVERIKNRKSLRRCVALTFDDGFKDNYENAYPILKKYNIPATIFLITGCIENGTAPWFIRVRYIFMKTQKTHFQFSLNNTIISLPMRTKNEKFEASEAAMAYLKNCPNDERLPLLDRFCQELGVTDFEELNDLMLNWDQIKEMSENDISFGAHTVTHPVVSSVPLNTIEREIRKSKEIVQSRAGKPPTSFAYPFGKRADYSPCIFPILEKLGFSCAVTTEKYPNWRSTNLFELNRSEPFELSLV